MEGMVMQLPLGISLRAHGAQRIFGIINCVQVTTVLPCDDVLALRGRMWELSLLYDMDIQNFK
jgi:hypothetical protein